MSQAKKNKMQKNISEKKKHSEKEIQIDPGNEHHSRTDADDKVFDEDVDRSPHPEADPAGDEGGTMHAELPNQNQEQDLFTEE
jgi:hypothetical protein